MSDSTGRWVWIDVPQSPLRIPPKYDAICTGGRAVEPELAAGRGELGRGGVRPGPCRRRVARDHPGDHERQDHDARDHQQARATRRAT